MILNGLDWAIITGFFLLSLCIGVYATQYAGRNVSEFFLSGRNMPWWLLGVSMVATTFSSDTPNLVTDIVRQNGVAGNWVWWAFLLTGMLTVFIYAKLWRRSNVMTDLAFYEIRYSGKAAAFLRGFRAIYLGGLFNIIIIASVSLALIKISSVMFHWSPAKTLIVASVITVVYSALGGLRGILLTDFFQFILAMIGAIGAALIVIHRPEIGGLQGLIQHESVIPKLNLLPDFNNNQELLVLLVLPLAIQWWSVWYPGAEPGGGGYIAQRMLSARSEKGATGATLFFNIAHYALRPWPWILVALASLIVFPDLASLRSAFPNADPQFIRHDFAYPAMLSLLPNGFLGLVVASLLAAFMSTASTHLNWGASYLVHDFYHRFVNPKATERRLITVGRVCTVFLMICSAGLALLLQNALQAFYILLQVGAGTGLIYILRWFWWRINAYSEISGMVISFLIACYFEFIHSSTGLPEVNGPFRLVMGVIITTLVWLLVTFVTKPADEKTLVKFYRLIHPGGAGWRKIALQAYQEDEQRVPPDERSSGIVLGIFCMILGCVTVFSALFATGYWIYHRTVLAVILSLVTVLGTAGLFRAWGRLHKTVPK